MLALCSMLSGTYYAHNYARIIGGSLIMKDHDAKNILLLKNIKQNFYYIRDVKPLKNYEISSPVNFIKKWHNEL